MFTYNLVLFQKLRFGCSRVESFYRQIKLHLSIEVSFLLLSSALRSRHLWFTTGLHDASALFIFTVLTVKKKNFLNAAAELHWVHDPARLDSLIHTDESLPFLLSGAPRVSRSQTMISRCVLPSFLLSRMGNIADKISSEDKLRRDFDTTPYLLPSPLSLSPPLSLSLRGLYI